MLRHSLVLLPLMLLTAGFSASLGFGDETRFRTQRDAAPVAVAGNHQAVLVGERVLLRAAGRPGAAGEKLTYSWKMLKRPSGSRAQVLGAGEQSVSFVADVAGGYALELTVSDGRRQSEPDLLTVSALTSRSEAVVNLVYVFDRLNYTDTSCFRSSKGKKLLTAKINAVLEKIEQGAGREALARLRSLLDRMDGCRGSAAGAADRNDWLDCETQAEIYPYLTAAMGALEASGL